MIGNDDSNRIDPTAPVGDFSTMQPVYRPRKSLFDGDETAPTDSGEKAEDSFWSQPDIEMKNSPDPLTDEQRERLDAQASMYVEGTANLNNQAAEQKRIEVRAKLDQLEKKVLDAIYAEAQFKVLPEYQRMINFAEKDEVQGSTEGEIKEFFDDLKATTQPGGFASLIVRSLTLPAEREQAVKAYREYRSMAESLGLA